MTRFEIKNVINFSGHPLSKTVVDELEKNGCTIETLPVGVDLQQSLADQSRELVDKIKGIPIDGSVPFMITLPGLSELTAFILAELHGRCGYFPHIIQIRRSSKGTFEIADFDFVENVELGIANLEKVRLRARGRRFKRNKK